MTIPLRMRILTIPLSYISSWPMTPSTVGDCSALSLSVGGWPFALAVPGAGDFVSSAKVTFLGKSSPTSDSALPLPWVSAFCGAWRDWKTGKGSGNWKKYNRSWRISASWLGMSTNNPQKLARLGATYLFLRLCLCEVVDDVFELLLRLAFAKIDCVGHIDFLLVWYPLSVHIHGLACACPSRAYSAPRTVQKKHISMRTNLLHLYPLLLDLPLSPLLARLSLLPQALWRHPVHLPHVLHIHDLHTLVRI